PMESPRELISLTLPSWTCQTKSGWYGTRFRSSGRPVMNESTRFRARSASTNQMNRLPQGIMGRLEGAGVPRPSGAGSTRQPDSVFGGGGGGGGGGGVLGDSGARPVTVLPGGAGRRGGEGGAGKWGRWATRGPARSLSSREGLYGVGGIRNSPQGRKASGPKETRCLTPQGQLTSYPTPRRRRYRPAGQASSARSPTAWQGSGLRCR